MGRELYLVPILECDCHSLSWELGIRINDMSWELGVGSWELGVGSWEQELMGITFIGLGVGN
ncbi:MAG: hypothetical protein ACYT04_80315 [Nostoc sp.]